MPDDIKRIRLKIKDDKRYKRLRDIYKTSTLFQLTVPEYTKEVRQLFQIRGFRTFNVNGTNSLSKLASLIVEDQSYRSRMIEIYATVCSAIKSLDDMLSRFQDYATVTYARDLKAVGAAKERERMVRNVMSEYYKYKDDLELLRDEIDLYVKDIDKAGFALKNLVETLALIERREGTLPNSRK